MNRLPLELEEDIISRVDTYRGIYKMSLLNRAAKQRLIQLGRDLALAYALELNGNVQIPESESLKDIQILLWRLVIAYKPPESQIRDRMLKYCMIQYSKPSSIPKLRRLAQKTAEEFANRDYLEEGSDMSRKEQQANEATVMGYIERFADRNPPLNASEKVYLLREVIRAFDEYSQDEFMTSRLVRFIMLFNKENLLSKNMLRQISV